MPKPAAQLSIVAALVALAASPRAEAAPTAGASQDAAAGASQDTGAGDDAGAPPAALSKEEARRLERLEHPSAVYARFFGTFAGGAGVRFNNPYRLETQLGAEASSASLTAPYLDVGAGLTFGEPDGLQHGAAVHVGGALTGVVQPYVTPSYVLAYRAALPSLLYARVGLPILLAPDANVGGEIAASGSYFFTSGLGLTGELGLDLFYGAATLDAQYSVIPILFLQLGVIVDYEFLP